MLTDFLTWMLNEATNPYIPEGILQGYEQALKDQLRNLIRRTRDPELRDKFMDQLNCPIRDSRGTCRSFTDYAVAALVKNGLHQRYDLEAALAYVFEKMLMDK